MDTATHPQNEFVAREQLWTLIHDIRFGMLVTRDTDGSLRSRPMTTQNSQLDEDASLWFFMSRASEAATDLQTSPSVCITYADPDEDTYVSVSGHAQVSDNKDKKQRLWTPLAKAWFPKGVDDPDLLLVRLSITHADYWDVKQSKLVQLWRIARAAVTGRPPKHLGEHGHVDVR